MAMSEATRQKLLAKAAAQQQAQQQTVQQVQSVVSSEPRKSVSSGKQLLTEKSGRRKSVEYTDTGYSTIKQRKPVLKSDVPPVPPDGNKVKKSAVKKKKGILSLVLAILFLCVALVALIYLMILSPWSDAKQGQPTVTSESVGMDISSPGLQPMVETTLSGDMSLVTVTLPADINVYNDVNSVQVYAQEQGYVSGQYDEQDGSATYTMTSETRDLEAAHSKQAVNDKIASYQIYTDMTHVSSIDVSSDYLTYTVHMLETSDYAVLRAIQYDLGLTARTYAIWADMNPSLVEIHFVDVTGTPIEFDI